MRRSLLFYCAMQALPVVTVVGATSLAGEREAHACGAAYPGGPVMCDYPRGDQGRGAPKRPVLRLSSSYAYTNTTILFGADRRADLTRHAAFVAAELPLSRASSSRFALQFGAGGIGNGALVSNASGNNPSRVYDVGPGFTAFTGLAWRVLDAKDDFTPFIHLTATFSFSHAATRSDVSNDRYTAVDFRFGAIVGKTLGDSGITPYIAARAFGGPVFWRLDGESVTGTDLYKYQLGGGLSVALFDRKIDVFVEGIGLGERGLAAGIGTTFF